MINVMLVCNAGMSTAMLAQKINKNWRHHQYVWVDINQIV